MDLQNHKKIPPAVTNDPVAQQKVLTKVRVSLSTERLGRYLGATKGDLKAAVELYELNLRLSQTLFGVLHGYEVALRNSMHDQLTRHFGQTNWYDKAPLNPWHRKQIDEAEEKCKPKVSYPSTSTSGVRTTPLPMAPVTPGQIIAAVSLAFWTGLTAPRYEQDLWTPCLRKAFPNIKANRVSTHRNLQDLQDLRNRIAHHERVLGSKGQLYIGVRHIISQDQFGTHHTRQDRFIWPELVLTVVDAICKDTATWLRTAAEFERCLEILRSEPARSLHI